MPKTLVLLEMGEPGETRFSEKYPTSVYIVISNNSVTRVPEIQSLRRKDGRGVALRDTRRLSATDSVTFRLTALQGR